MRHFKLWVRHSSHWITFFVLVCCILSIQFSSRAGSGIPSKVGGFCFLKRSHRLSDQLSDYWNLKRWVLLENYIILTSCDSWRWHHCWKRHLSFLGLQLVVLKLAVLLLLELLWGQLLALVDLLVGFGFAGALWFVQVFLLAGAHLILAQQFLTDTVYRHMFPRSHLDVPTWDTYDDRSISHLWFINTCIYIL